jgi:hypothetical protein
MTVVEIEQTWEEVSFSDRETIDQQLEEKGLRFLTTEALSLSGSEDEVELRSRLLSSSVDRVCAREFDELFVVRDLPTFGSDVKIAIPPVAISKYPDSDGANVDLFWHKAEEISDENYTRVRGRILARANKILARINRDPFPAPLTLEEKKANQKRTLAVFGLEDLAVLDTLGQ